MSLLEKILNFTNGTKYASSNIKTSDGVLAYVTATGVAKKYPSDDVFNATVRGNTGTIQLMPTWNDLGFPVGSLMKSGQSYGDENTYVQSSPPKNNFDWQFYIQHYPQLKLTTEQQAIQHWNTVGQQSGFMPNATILSSMANLGKVGYIDIDTNLHQVPATYDGTYQSYSSVSNVTGSNMIDCSQPRPLVNYGDQLQLQCDNGFGFLNPTSNLQFARQSGTNFFLRPAVNSPFTGNIKYGDQITITTSLSNYTQDCGWWGCKVATVNNVTKRLEFGPGGASGYTFQILPPRGSQYALGASIHYEDPFIISASITLNNTTLAQGMYLRAGQSIKSSNGNYMLIYQTDGNVCIYNTSGGAPIWSSSTPHTPGRLKLQPNGVLVATDSGNVPRWSTGNGGSNGPYSLMVKNDGNVVLVDLNKNTVWSTNTSTSTDNSSTYTMPYFGYVKRNIMMFGLWGSNNVPTFSFKSNIVYDPACKVDDLKSQCTTSPDCRGFVHSPSTNSWQMIKSTSTASDYAITNKAQDVYLKNASVQLNDSSCMPGKVKFLDATNYSGYPSGPNFMDGVTGQCNVLKLDVDYDTYNKTNQAIMKQGKTYADQYNPTAIEDAVKQTKSINDSISEKSDEFQKTLTEIKKSGPTKTLEQRQRDLQVLDKYNRIWAIVWGIIAMIILAILVFRPK